MGRRSPPPADISVKAPEVQRAALWMIGAFGLASCAFGIAAELGRVQSFKIHIPPGAPSPQCLYPPSPSLAFAVAATVSLLAAQLGGLLLGSFAWCRGARAPPSTAAGGAPILGSSRMPVAVALVAQLLFSATAIATLLSTALQNASLPLTPLSADPETPKCYLVEEGVFLTAAVLALFATILACTYYVLSVGFQRDVWVDAYSAAPLEGLEMMARDTETIRVAPGTSSHMGVGDEEEDDDEFLGDGDFQSSTGPPNRTSVPRP